MKKFLVKALLLFVLLSGTLIGLVSYSETSSWLIKAFGFRFNWALVILACVVSLFVARKGFKILNQEFLTIQEIKEITSIKLLNFFLGGFVGVYIGVIIVGTVIYSSYIVFRGFFLP